MTDEKLVKLLKSALEDSKCKKEVWRKMNGFDILAGYKTVVDGDKLASKIKTIIDLLENN
ncbi:hypothetical protein [Vibrio phage JSF13]|jgi:hypothetical protein|uniref:Uncharacterized protein ORF42 n=1 Tax=Vibrio phage ICP1 TaxID=979525 RepID=F1D164_9CAUD|nr:hypothetical protein ViPhICP1_gp042 [Vibrio phage ICP1]ADX88085.1 hypothetical protein TUST1-191_00195 [Vibrio phage ICP1_2006_D]ADX88312.1 hypothetical protein TUST1-182_00195 [Vibrio phage ICP1_2006_C]ADX88539.1 hypothetical protein TUST1-159_00195 [Vibrio phage ICP1_2006_B]ADX88765.1 hypothetical protein TUST1-17_00195 [Vibrio phage ICP1_2006_A]ADX88991.1 hypothetical protein TUST1-15_00195 [Vibrio phage ICP1_2005_A]ADX89223.1 hypothetical protein TUST1-2_00205 [Vibrio phage ICP1_2001_A